MPGKKSHTTLLALHLKMKLLVNCLLLFEMGLLLLLSCQRKTETAKDTDTYYTCSMDPQVIESKPGKCPICHMKLTSFKKSSTQNKDEIQ